MHPYIIEDQPLIPTTFHNIQSRLPQSQPPFRHPSSDHPRPLVRACEAKAYRVPHQRAETNPCITPSTSTCIAILFELLVLSHILDLPTLSARPPPNSPPEHLRALVSTAGSCQTLSSSRRTPTNTHKPPSPIGRISRWCNSTPPPPPLLLSSPRKAVPQDKSTHTDT